MMNWSTRSLLKIKEKAGKNEDFCVFIDGADRRCVG